MFTIQRYRPQLSLVILLVIAGVCTSSCSNTAQEPISTYFNRAQPLLAEQRYTEAATILEEAAQAHLQDTTSLLKIGQIYLAQHRWLLAEDAFNRTLARDLDNAPAMAGLAESLLNQGRLNEALKWWTRATVADPELPGVFTGLGRTHLAMLNFEAAQDAFSEQQTHSSDFEAAWYLATLIAPRDRAAAIAILDTISPKAGGSPTLVSERDYLLETVTPFNSESSLAEVAKAVGIAMAQIEQWPLAIHALNIALSTPVDLTQEDQAEALAFLGYARAQAGRPALELFEQARQADPHSALPLYFEGLYLRQQEVFSAATAAFEQAIKLDPKNAALYAEIAQTKIQQGSFSTAEIWYKAAIEVAEDELPFRLMLLQLYASRNYRTREAGIPLAERIIKVDRNNAEVHDMLGWMQFLTGAANEGEQSLRQALELEPNLISAHYHLARLLESRGQHHSAREEYQRVVDLDISGNFREQALKDLLRSAAK